MTKSSKPAAKPVKAWAIEQDGLIWEDTIRDKRSSCIGAAKKLWCVNDWRKLSRKKMYQLRCIRVLITPAPDPTRPAFYV